jgi:hypothetical protein
VPLKVPLILVSFTELTQIELGTPLPAEEYFYSTPELRSGGELWPAFAVADMILETPCVDRQAAGL